MIRDQIKLYSNYNSIPFRCLCCHENTHTVVTCPKVHFVPNVQEILKEENGSQNQERNLKFIRSEKHKKMNARFLREKMFDQALRLNLGTYGELNSFSEFDEQFLQANYIFAVAAKSREGNFEKKLS